MKHCTNGGSGTDQANRSTDKELTIFANTQDFTSDSFSDTKWEKSEKKAKFASQFIKFVESDFDREKFPHAFYLRLALCFGHIAHYNQAGFYEEFFTATHDKVRFLRHTLQDHCWGDPALTYSDVEKALQSWVAQNNILGQYEERLSLEQEAEERAKLALLQSKYGNRERTPK